MTIGPDATHHDRAIDAILEAVGREKDFGAWLAAVLAAAAAELGSTAALTAGRPGSWEADLVHRLVYGTVGYGDEYLADYRRPARGACAESIDERHGPRGNPGDRT